MTEELTSTFHSSVDAGKARLERHWPGLLATGMVGGIDVGIGVFGLFVVHQATDNVILGSLAFTIGFIALILANSELFTENFLVPVAAVAAGRSTPRALLRLWAGTAAMNLAGGWCSWRWSWPALQSCGRRRSRSATTPFDLGIGATSFASAGWAAPSSP